MSHKSRITDESGIALITSLLVLMLASALMAGIFAAVQSDLREAATDRDQTQAYAAAHAGLEQLTAGLAELFMQDVSPDVADIDAVAANAPAINGFQYLSPGGGDGFTIDYLDVNPADGSPDVLADTAITTGPFTGFIGLITPYTMTVTARSNTGHSEVRLRRSLQTVAVPVFQFGMFSETDLSVFAGGGFRFGGRVHTNGSLFVAAQTNASAAINITFNDRVTAVNEVIRRFLSNGLDNSTTAPSFNNQVRMPSSSTTTAVLTQSPNMGSVAGMPGSAVNPLWFGYSTGNPFNSFVRNGASGARRLDLPLVSQGAQPIDLIRRPLQNSNEDAVAPLVFAQRFYGQASLRILLSDRPADFVGLPTVVGTPVRLGADDGAANNWTLLPPAGYGPVSATRAPIARSIGPASTVTVSAGGNGGALQAPVAQFYVADNAAAIPNVFKIAGGGLIQLNTAPVQNLTCRGKTGATAITFPANINANAFFGCTALTAAAPAGTTVTATIDGRQVTATLTVNAALGATELRVGADQTAPFSETNLIWVNNPNALVAGTAVPISCEGYSDVPVNIGGTNVRRFLACRGLTSVPTVGMQITTSAVAAKDTNRIGGYILINKQDDAGVWTDVTMEILNLGIGDANSGGTICADPSPNAVIRLQRLRDNGGGTCTYAGSMNSYDWWPQGLYDAREGSFRDSATAGAVQTQTSPMKMIGVMQHVALDVANLKRWLAGTIGATGTTARNDNGNGFIVYFSDRRGNHDPAAGDAETGEFGFEDHINSASADGLPDGALQAGEDVNIGDPRWPANSQQLYGGIPWNNAENIPTGASGLYTFANARPQTVIPIGNTAGSPGAGQARVSKVVLFRRALKIVRGGIGILGGGVSSLPDAGLTIAAENPVYVHGNFNADATAPNADWSNVQPNRPAAIIADAVSLLSNNWSDARSFEVPNRMPSRPATTTSYRFASIAGKGLSFPYCGGACGNPGHLFGTDGGAGNFFRLLEDWGATGASPNGIRYRGSIVSLHNNRQAIGAYKFASANNHHYNAGPRNFTYDVDFLVPANLPPGTPMFRDINTLQFRQILRPNQP